MTSIRVDDQTAQRLQAVAAAHGLPVQDYLRLLLAERTPVETPELSPTEFDAELDRLSFDGPSLPTGFSRADIYADHD